MRKRPEFVDRTGHRDLDVDSWIWVRAVYLTEDVSFRALRVCSSPASAVEFFGGALRGKDGRVLHRPRIPLREESLVPVGIDRRPGARSIEHRDLLS